MSLESRIRKVETKRKEQARSNVNDKGVCLVDWSGSAVDAKIVSMPQGGVEGIAEFNGETVPVLLHGKLKLPDANLKGKLILKVTNVTLAIINDLYYTG